MYQLNYLKEFLRKKYMKRGGTMACIGCSLWLFSPFILNWLFSQIMVLKENTLLFNLWKTPDIPIPIKLYIYHIDNPDDFVDGKKAKLVQKGPYVYE